jgi:uncharacterized protein YcbK (DUF882 family)
MTTPVHAPTRRSLLGLTAAILFGGRASSRESSSIPSGVSDTLRDLHVDDRTPLVGTHPLRIRNTNTDEEVAIPIMQGDQGYLAWNEMAFSRLDWLFRDWRENISVRIDRRIYVFLYLLQALSERAHGVRSHVELTSGFRTERTNSRLRGIYRETVALNSFHTRGQAVDFRVSGLSTRICATLAWSLDLGGVGLYGDRFVHCDTGPRRRWGDPFPI